MTDPFTDRVADLASRSAQAMKELADRLQESHPADADLVRKMGLEHAKVARDCLTETQPLDPDRRSPGRQLRDLAEEARQVAATLAIRHIPGHDAASEAAELLENAGALADTKA